MKYIDFNKLNTKQYKKLSNKYEVLIFKISRQRVLYSFGRIIMRHHYMIFLKKPRGHYYCYLRFRGEKLERKSPFPSSWLIIKNNKKEWSDRETYKSLKQFNIKIKGMSFKEFQEEYFDDLLRL